MSSFSWKQKWTAITPKPFAFISILSSTYIIQHVLKSRKRRSEVFHRLLLGLSLCDLFASTSFFLGTWPIPVGTKGVYLASGNKATCDAQGFFQQFFGVAPPLYNGSLAVYYFLIIRYGWKNGNPKLKVAEKLLHAVPLLYATITAVIGSALDMYRSSNLWCWVAGQYQITRMIFLYGPVWLSFIVTSFCMIKIYCEVRAQEAKTKKYNSSVTSAGRSDLPQRTDHSRRFANQAMRVKSICVYCIVYHLHPSSRIFFNVLVYLRPKYLKFKKRHADKNMCQLILLGCGCSGERAMRMSVFHISGRSSTANFSRFNGKSSVSKVEVEGIEEIMEEDEDEPNEPNEIDANQLNEEQA
eukprot:scaffold11106_cov100-Skeletonema_dohrnii-CCMP3373.AAC.1